MRGRKIVLEHNLTYGVDSNGQLVHIDSVARGRNCQCTCPNCGEELIAKQGAKKIWHFAHAVDSNCKEARMTALHLLAQEIVKKRKSVRLPRYEGMYAPAIESRVITFDDVILEKTYHSEDINRRPDCIGIKCDKYGNNREIWIEIKVTHEIDQLKMQDIKKQNITCIEIDLSELLETNYTADNIYELLITKPDKIKWINSPILDKKDLEYKKKKESVEAANTQKSCEIQAYIDKQHNLEEQKRKQELATEKTSEDIYRPLGDKEYFEAWKELAEKFEKALPLHQQI